MNEVGVLNELLSAEQLERLRRRAAAIVVGALRGDKLTHLPCPEVALEAPRGVFVTLRRAERLAGCIGYVEAPWPLWDTLAEAARSAALEDSRFERVPADALDEVDLEISVLTPPREIRPENFEVGRHGLCLEFEAHRGLLLPQVALEHSLDHHAFLEALCQKAGVPPMSWKQEGCRLLAFEAQIAEGPLLSPGDEQR